MFSCLRLNISHISLCQYLYMNVVESLSTQIFYDFFVRADCIQKLLWSMKCQIFRSNVGKLIIVAGIIGILTQINTKDIAYLHDFVLTCSYFLRIFLEGRISRREERMSFMNESDMRNCVLNEQMAFPVNKFLYFYVFKD